MARKAMSLISGTVERENLVIRYWSEYRDDAKVMYFRIDNLEEFGDLKPIKGLRRNKQAGYYSVRIAGPSRIINKIVEAYTN